MRRGKEILTTSPISGLRESMFWMWLWSMSPRAVLMMVLVDVVAVGAPAREPLVSEGVMLSSALCTIRRAFWQTRSGC